MCNFEFDTNHALKQKETAEVNNILFNPIYPKYHFKM